MNKENIAKICNEANKAYCEGIGDKSQHSWNNAPDGQNPEAPASASHDSWLEVKKAEGWKYGKYKDAQKKTHPCYVPYDELPEDQKKKDALFKSIVAAVK